MKPKCGGEMRTRIRDLRERKGLTLQEIAAKVDMNFQSLSRIELGTQDPSAIHIVKLADFFGVTTDFLLHHESQMPPVSDKIIYKERDLNYQSIKEYMFRAPKEELIKIAGLIDGLLQNGSSTSHNTDNKLEPTTIFTVPKR